MLACLSIIIIGGGYLVYLRCFDGTIIRPVTNLRNNIVFQTTQTAYKSGDPVYVYSKAFCQYRKADTVVEWQLQDDVLLSLTPMEVNNQIGCYEAGKIIKIGEIPNYVGAANKLYKFSGDMVLHVNQLRDVTIEVSTNTFSISK